MSVGRFRRTVGSLLVLVGAAMAVAHLIAHLADMRVRGLTDLLIGFPTAAMLMVLGLLLLGLQAHPRRDPPAAGGQDRRGAVTGRVETRGGRHAR